MNFLEAITVFDKLRFEASRTLKTTKSLPPESKINTELHIVFYGRLKTVIAQHTDSSSNINRLAVIQQLEADMKSIQNLPLSSAAATQEYLTYFRMVCLNELDIHGIDVKFSELNEVIIPKPTQNPIQLNEVKKAEEHPLLPLNAKVLKRIFEEDSDKLASRPDKRDLPSLDDIFLPFMQEEKAEKKIHILNLPMALQFKILDLTGSTSTGSESKLSAGLLKAKDAKEIMARNKIWDETLLENYGYQKKESSDLLEPRQIYVLLAKLEERNLEYFKAIYFNNVCFNQLFPALECKSLPDNTSLEERQKTLNQAALIGNLALMQWLSDPARGNLRVEPDMSTLQLIARSGSIRSLNWGIQLLNLDVNTVLSEQGFISQEKSPIYHPSSEQAYTYLSPQERASYFDDGMDSFSQNNSDTPRSTAINLFQELLKSGNQKLVASFYPQLTYNPFTLSTIFTVGDTAFFDWYYRQHQDQILRDVNADLIVKAAGSGNYEIFRTIYDDYQRNRSNNLIFKSSAEELKHDEADNSFRYVDFEYINPMADEKSKPAHDTPEHINDLMNPDAKGLAMLNAAVLSGNINVVKSLIEECKVIPVDAIALPDKMNLLSNAALKGNAKLLFWLSDTLELKLDNPLLTAVPPGKIFPVNKEILDRVANSGNAELMKELILKHGLVPDETTLNHACASNNLHSVAWLTSPDRKELRVIPTDETLSAAKSPRIKAYLETITPKPQLSPSGARSG